MAQGQPRGILPRLLLPVLSLIRGAVPGGLGMHQITVTRKAWQWAGADGGHAVDTGVATPLPDLVIGHYSTTTGLVEPPHVDLTSGGSEATVNFITCAWFDAMGAQAGGFTAEQLNPGDAAGYEWCYTLGLPQGPRNYILAPRGLTSHPPFHYQMHLVSTSTQTPF
jgi:uncharacterized protein YodC (DUF2158 family)